MTIRVLFIGNYDMAAHNIRPEAEMIIGLARLGFGVEVMTGPRGEYVGRMRAAGIRVHEFVPDRKLSLAAIRRIRRALVEGRFDVVHLFNNRAIANGLLAAVGLPLAAVTYRGQTGNISRYDPACYLTHLSPRVDRIVCVADAVRASLAPEVREPARLVTIYKGHDIDWYRDVPAASRDSLDVPADAVLVGCVATNRPRKGVPVLVAAVGRLPRDAGVHVLLVGGGMDEPELARAIAASSHADRFRVLGHREDVLSLVAACDLTVLPAVKREGLPKTVIESMALGVPPVVTATGGSPELVLSGHSGLVVPPGDADALAEALLALARDPVRRRRLGARARQRIAESFSLHDSIAAHAALYESLVAERRRAA